MRTNTASATCSGRTSSFEQGAGSVVLAHRFIRARHKRQPADACQTAGECPRTTTATVSSGWYPWQRIKRSIRVEQVDINQTWCSWSAFAAPVSDIFSPGERGILTCYLHDVTAHGLTHHHPGRLPSEQETSPHGHNGVLEAPILNGGVEQAFGNLKAGVVDHQVDAAECQYRLAQRLGYVGFPS